MSGKWVARRTKRIYIYIYIYVEGTSRRRDKFLGECNWSFCFLLSLILVALRNQRTPASIDINPRPRFQREGPIGRLGMSLAPGNQQLKPPVHPHVRQKLSLLLLVKSSLGCFMLLHFPCWICWNHLKLRCFSGHAHSSCGKRLQRKVLVSALPAVAPVASCCHLLWQAKAALGCQVRYRFSSNKSGLQTSHGPMGDPQLHQYIHGFQCMSACLS